MDANSSGLKRLYYPFFKAAELVGVSPHDLIHFGATGQIEMMMKVPVDWELTSQDRWHKDTDCPAQTPKFVVLRKEACLEIEDCGHASVGEFDFGYDSYTDAKRGLFRCNAFEVVVDTSKAKQRRDAWEYIEISGKLAVVREGDIYVLASELEKFSSAAQTAADQIPADLSKELEQANARIKELETELAEAKKVQQPVASEKPRPQIRESTALDVVAILLAENYTKGKPPSAKDMERSAQAAGISISDDSISKVLKEAQSRMVTR